METTTRLTDSRYMPLTTVLTISSSERYLLPDRWQNTDALATYAIPATTARYFKFCWTPEGSNPGSEDMDAAKWKPNLKIGGLNLGSEPVIDGYEGSREQYGGFQSISL